MSLSTEDQKVIEEVINLVKQNVYGFQRKVVDKLRDLLPPEPERIGGLTIPEWQQLAELGDVLVEVLCGEIWVPKYLREVHPTKDLHFSAYNNGATSITWTNSPHYKCCRLIEDDRWRLNKGHQPVPDGVKVGCVTKGGRIIQLIAKNTSWSLNDGDRIVAYRIIGVEE